MLWRLQRSKNAFGQGRKFMAAMSRRAILTNILPGADDAPPECPAISGDHGGRRRITLTENGKAAPGFRWSNAS
jgi:hypothetical protein